MNLTDHFTLEEMVASQVATRRGFDNTPPPDALANLGRVAKTLEQVRQLVGAPVRVSSGYRCPALNRAVGGAADSAHTKGLAADITVQGLTPKALALLIRESGIVFDQLIVEFDQWVHLGLSANAPRCQVLTAKRTDNGTFYSKGIS